MMANDHFGSASHAHGSDDLDARRWETSYVEAVRDVFSRFPEKTALAYMGTHISFGDIDRYANRFAHMLSLHGFVKGDVVCICLPNIPEFVIAWLGTLRAGCVVSGASPFLTTEQIAFQLHDSHARGLVTLPTIIAEKLPSFAGNLTDLKLVLSASTRGFLSPVKCFLSQILMKTSTDRVTGMAGKRVFHMQGLIKGTRFPSDAPVVALGPNDIALLMYTSGTQGAPRGVMLNHRNILAGVGIICRWFGWESKYSQGISLSGLPLSRTLGLIFSAGFLFSGWTQVLIPDPGNYGHICAEMHRYQPLVVTNLPSVYRRLIDWRGFKKLDFSNLECCISGTEPFPGEEQHKLETIVGQGKLLDVYGTTETAGIIAANPRHGRKRLGTVGLPLNNTDIRIIDPLSGKTAAPGEPGELCVKGPQVMPGYFRRPDETAHAIDGDNYLRTGDIVLQDNHGYLLIVERTLDMILAGRFKVFSTEVEDILGRHPAVGRAALIGIDDPDRPGTILLKACITLKPTCRVSDVEALKKEILAYAHIALPPHEVPEQLEIRTELPLNALGKVDRQALRKQARAQVWAGQERRSQIRGLVDLPCDITGISNGRQTHAKAHVVDLSGHGMFIKAEFPLDKGTDAAIEAIRFGETFWVMGKVIRCTEKGMAIKFSQNVSREIEGILNSGRK